MKAGIKLHYNRLKLPSNKYLKVILTNQKGVLQLACFI